MKIQDNNTLKKIYIWGTGYEAGKCTSNINLAKCIILGYIETKPSKSIWQNKRVYAYEKLPDRTYDYIIIASTYYEEIFDYINQRELIDDKKIINWMKIKEYIYYYPAEIWELFSNTFLNRNSNFYFFSNTQKGDSSNLVNNLSVYEKIYVYDLRLIDRELDIGMMIYELINNLKDKRNGMAFIPNEDFINENWYHNILCVLNRHAFVIWKELEGIYLKYVKENPEKISFEKYNVLQFERQQKQIVKKSKYMFYDVKLIYKEKQQLINQAQRIHISLFRCDRIGEQIRILNQLMYQKNDLKIFNLYIPVDAYSRPFEGVNTCFNEIIARKFNLLKNKEEYSLWVCDIFEHIEKYQFCGKIEVINYGNGEKLKNNCPVISLNERELKIGRNILKNEFNISDDFVCLFTRDAKYLKEILPNVNTSYHNYRDVPFDVMDMAIEYFDRCKIQTIRMGQTTEYNKINRKCIDFSNYEYDEYLDLILHYYSKFFLGCSAGISMLPMFWNKPTATLMPYYPCKERNIKSGKEDLCIFNRLYSVKKKKELSFEELFSYAYSFYTEGECKGEYFEQHSLKIIPFSQEDVLELAMEMNERLDGIWLDETDDVDLYKRFEEKIYMFIERKGINKFELWMPRVATSYLRKYKYLLED